MSNHTQLPLPLPDTTIEIPLTHGQFAIVDAIDADLLEFKWSALQGHNTFYTKRMTKRPNQKIIYIHRVILSRMLGRELTYAEKVDHVDRNGLNCTRSNLRLATHTENKRNTKRQKNNTSGYKGVTFHKGTQKWCARITVDSKDRHIGLFNTPEEAHEAYKKAAIELHGEFARFE